MKKKSDFQKFCETNWIMFKYDILPWVVAVGLYGGFIIKLGQYYKGSKEKIEIMSVQNNTKIK